MGNSLYQSLLIAFSLSQAGEFGFVIMGFCMQLNIVPSMLANQVMVVIAMSMLATPFLLLINERLIYPNTRSKAKKVKQESDFIDEDNANIVAFTLLALSKRPTVLPKCPKPAIIIALSSSIKSLSCFTFLALERVFG